MKRVAKFKCTSKFIDDCYENGYNLFDDIFVLRCEHIFYEDTFEYHLLSKKFEEINMCEIAPTYTCDIEKDEENVTIKWKKIDE